MPDKPVWSLDEIVAQLTNWGTAWSTAKPIPYAFSEQAWGFLGNPPAFSPFFFQQRASLAATMQLISDVANVTFAQVPDNGIEPGAGNERIIFFNVNSANTPFWGALTEFYVDEQAVGFDRIMGGQIVVNQHRASVQGEWGLGDSNSRKLMHELLHALGLDHPGPYNGDSANYENQALFQQDSVQYTTMSYWAASQTGADHLLPNGFRFAATPLLYDVASLQALYGANMTTRTGDTVYGFNSNAGRAALDLVATPGSIFTLWDAGGVDTLDLSGWSDGVVLNLAEGGFSSGGGMTDRISIAYGAIVENGVAGAGNDKVSGNAASNFFYLQLGGSDLVAGLAGGDGFYFGGAYDALDRVDGGEGTDTLALQGRYSSLILGEMIGVEVLLVAAGTDTRFGRLSQESTIYDITTIDGNVAAGAVLTVQAAGLRAGGESLRFNGSAETDGHFRVFAGRDIDNLTGGKGSDGFFFGADLNLSGADRIRGGDGADSIALRGNHVGAGAVTFQDGSFDGVEVLVMLSGRTNEYGGFIVADGFDYAVTMADGNVGAGQQINIVALTLSAGEDLLFDGRAETDGAYRLLSGAGNDIITSGAGNDYIYGGLGADRLYGGGGGDLFVYRGAAESRAASFDTLVGFDANVDRIDLAGDINGIAASLTDVTLSLATVGIDLAGLLADALGVGQAVSLLATGGDLAGRLFVVADGNGIAGFQADGDYLVELLEPAAPIAPGPDFFI